MVIAFFVHLRILDTRIAQSVVEDIKNMDHPIVAMTIVIESMRDHLYQLCAAANIPAVDLLWPLVGTLQNVLKMNPIQTPGVYMPKDARYFHTVKVWSALEATVVVALGRLISAAQGCQGDARAVLVCLVPLAPPPPPQPAHHPRWHPRHAREWTHNTHTPRTQGGIEGGWAHDALAARRTKRRKGQAEGCYVPLQVDTLGPKSRRRGGFSHRRYGVHLDAPGQVRAVALLCVDPT